MRIDKARFEQALAHERQQSYFPIFAGQSAYSDYDDLNLAGLEARLATLPTEFDLRELLALTDPRLDFSPEWPKRALLIARLALAAPAVGWVPQPRHVAGDWLLETDDAQTPTYVFGDLTVTGSLTNQGRLVVLGNVTVGNAWADDSYNYGEAVVAGHLTAGRSVLTGGMLAVGGCLQAPYVYLDFNQGYTTVLGGCRARLLLESDHGGSWIFGEARVEYLDTDELQFEHEPAAASPVAGLAELFQAEFAAPFAARYAAEQAARQAAEQAGELDFEPDYELRSDLQEAVLAGFQPDNGAVLRPVPGWPAA